MKSMMLMGETGKEMRNMMGALPCECYNEWSLNEVSYDDHAASNSNVADGAGLLRIVRAPWVSMKTLVVKNTSMIATETAFTCISSTFHLTLRRVCHCFSMKLYDLSNIMF